MSGLEMPFPEGSRPSRLEEDLALGSQGCGGPGPRLEPSLRRRGQGAPDLLREEQLEQGTGWSPARLG